MASRTEEYDFLYRTVCPERESGSTEHLGLGSPLASGFPPSPFDQR